MTQDVRAYIYCSLGEVISGSISESSVIDSGLVKVSGNIILNGVYAPQRGQVVLLGYYKQGRIGAIGRKLRVLGYYANPITRTTEVSIGCFLTYHSETQPAPVALNSDDTEDNLNLTELDKLALLSPTNAATIFAYCCNALGITYALCPLTNQFFEKEFTIEMNYIDLISDLLKSENYVGYLDATEQLQYIYLPDATTRGPVLTEENIIEISPIQSNLLPADYVYSNVPYRQIKLDDAVRDDTPSNGDFTETQMKSTVKDRSYPYTLSGSEYEVVPSNRKYRYEDPDTKNVRTDIIEWYPSTKWTANYDDQGRLVERYETKVGIYGFYYKHDTIVYTDYGNGYEEQYETSIESGPSEVFVEALGLPEEVMAPLPKGVPITYTNPDSEFPPGLLPGITDVAETFVSDGWNTRTIRRTRSTPYSVHTSNYEYTLAINTSDGAESVKNYIDSYKDNPGGVSISQIIGIGMSIVLAKGTHTTESKKPEYKINEGAPLSFYPSPANETGRLGDASDRAATYSTSIETKVEILYNTQTQGIVIEFTPPYLSDDRIVKNGNLYEVISSDAPQKARAYAYTQNKLRLGQINGQSIVLPIEYTPASPFSTVYLDFNNVVGAFKFDNVTIAFDNTGILFSADCLFWGGVGQ